MRVAVEKIEGVTSAAVSLKEGMATIQFAPSNSVRTEQIRQAIRSNGFTPKEAEIRVAGALLHRADTLLLAVPGTEERFMLQDDPAIAAQLDALRQLGPNERATIIGQVPAPEGRSGKSSRMLLVRSFVAGQAGMNR